jgi:hypothetical protein
VPALETEFGPLLELVALRLVPTMGIQLFNLGR